jgi:hypothetical protein
MLFVRPANIVTACIVVFAGVPLGALAQADARNLCREHDIKLAQCSETLETCTKLFAKMRNQRDALQVTLELAQRPAQSCPVTDGAAVWRKLVMEAIDHHLRPIHEQKRPCESLEYELADPVTLHVRGRLLDPSIVNTELGDIRNILPTLQIDQQGLLRQDECLTALGGGYGVDSRGPLARDRPQWSRRLPPATDCPDIGRVIEQGTASELAEIKEGKVDGVWVRDGDYVALCYMSPDGWKTDNTNLGSKSGLVIIKSDGGG